MTEPHLAGDVAEAHPVSAESWGRGAVSSGILSYAPRAARAVRARAPPHTVARPPLGGVVRRKGCASWGRQCEALAARFGRTANDVEPTRAGFQCSDDASTDQVGQCSRPSRFHQGSDDGAIRGPGIAVALKAMPRTPRWRASRRQAHSLADLDRLQLTAKSTVNCNLQMIVANNFI